MAQRVVQAGDGRGVITTLRAEDMRQCGSWNRVRVCGVGSRRSSRIKDRVVRFCGGKSFVLSVTVSIPLADKDSAGNVVFPAGYSSPGLAGDHQRQEKS